MRSPGTSGENIKRKCTVYDVIEKDRAKKVIGVFESVSECAKFLGLRTARVCDLIKYKTRNNNKKLGKLICIR
jgi:hypothetical protein